MSTKQKLELNWIGKHKRPRLEPRILLEDKALSYGDVDSENLLIQGDNLLALKALEQKYAGKVKCIYIDPPYNTGSAFVEYDDGLEHSIWLSLLRDRITLLKSLLTEDGSLWISIDDNEYAYLKILCDEILGRQNFVATIIWEKRKTRENRRVFSFNHDFVLVYANNKSIFDRIRNPLQMTDEIKARYKNPDNDPRGPWQSISALAQAGHGTASQFYEITLPSGKVMSPSKGNCWRYSKKRMDAEIAEGRIWFGKDGNNAPRIKKYLSESKDQGVTPETLWKADDVGTTDSAKKHVNQLMSDLSFETPKPEELLSRIIHIATNPGDLVLDSFAGSGTTGAVAHKMNRRWIMVELGDHCHTHIVPRLKKVINSEDPGGISKSVSWQGGGGFRYLRLAPSLLKKDHWGNWVINKEYNAEMLAEAMCKHMNFTYAPSQTQYWNHGYSTETDYIYVTTGSLAYEQLKVLSEEVGTERTLLICCKAFMTEGADFPNLTLVKIPRAILSKCEWDQDDYSFTLNVLSDSEQPDDIDYDENTEDEE
ncbi:site-specific DNA-methyltransferase [Salmonella enterica]|nr:site-specific DNA-methyltransferase [Salmonella enterica]EDR9809547.1 site-specific DNA-methyltransferase [Salmonella enterica]